MSQSLSGAVVRLSLIPAFCVLLFPFFYYEEDGQGPSTIYAGGIEDLQETGLTGTFLINQPTPQALSGLAYGLGLSIVKGASLSL